MIWTVPCGATRDALVADLARIEALENDPGWDDARQAAKEELGKRIERLERSGHDAELRREEIPLDPSIVT